MGSSVAVLEALLILCSDVTAPFREVKAEEGPPGGGGAAVTGRGQMVPPMWGFG